MHPAKTGFLACFDTRARAADVVGRLNRVTVSAHVLTPVDGSDDLVESRRGVGGIFAGASTGAVVGIGVGALTAIILPGPGTLVLAGILASIAGFGSGGAVVGGLLGALSADEAVEETVQFVQEKIASGKTVIVVETDTGSHDAAVELCRAAGAGIRELKPAESSRFAEHPPSQLPENTGDQTGVATGS